MDDFRIRIDRILTEKRWKKPQLAEASGVNYDTIKTWFNRSGSRPNVSDMYRIAKALDTTVEYLWAGEKSERFTRKHDPLVDELYHWIEQMEDRNQLMELKGILKYLASNADERTLSKIENRKKGDEFSVKKDYEN